MSPTLNYHLKHIKNHNITSSLGLFLRNKATLHMIMWPFMRYTRVSK